LVSVYQHLLGLRTLIQKVDEIFYAEFFATHNFKSDYMNKYSYMSDICDVFCINKDAVNTVRSQMLSSRLVTDTAEIFKVLGDPTRMRLLYALAQRELCVYDLSAVLGMTQSAISHQLRVLRSARLVRYRKVGRVVYYALADAHVTQFIDVGVDHARESQQR
jgi:DNA-binding transcriptional ArsR family regulator